MSEYTEPRKMSAFIRFSFLAAPALLFLYGIAHYFDGLDGSYGPGIAWTVGHVMFLLALFMFGVVIVGLSRRVGSAGSKRKILARTAATVGLIGLVVFVRVSVIDILTGLRAPNNAAMGAISTQLNSYPSLKLVPYYNLGPLLFQLGLLVLMLQLAILKPRQTPWWSPLLLLLGFFLLAYNLNFLILGSLLIAFALMPLVLKPKPNPAK